MSDIIKLHLFKHGGKAFFRLMSEENIPIQLKRHDPGTVMAAGEVIEIVKVVGGLSIVPSLAAVIVQWLKNKASRKIMVQTKDNVIVSLEGQDANREKLEELLEIAYSVSAIQTQPDQDNDA
jgi:Effector Associated Constant Component 1